MLENVSKRGKANGDANEVETIVEYGFKVSKSLKKIDLRGNQIGDEVACCLSEALKRNKSLKSVKLDWKMSSKIGKVSDNRASRSQLDGDAMVLACEEAVTLIV